jgi:hypothetical protein
MRRYIPIIIALVLFPAAACAPNKVNVQPNTPTSAPTAIATSSIPANSASISGVVWHDQCVSGAPGQPGPMTAPEGCVLGAQGGYEANGTRETGELGIAAVPVSLFGPECDVNNIPDNAAITQTDYVGRFSFENLPAGTYCLGLSTAELIPGGWTSPEAVNADGLSVITLQDAQKVTVEFGWDHQFLPIPEPVQLTPTTQATVDSMTAQSIEIAMSEYVAARPGLSSAFKVSVDKVEGDYARVTVHSTDPQGGFSGFLRKYPSKGWTVIFIGSGINPEELEQMGVPASLLQ